MAEITEEKYLFFWETIWCNRPFITRPFQIDAVRWEYWTHLHQHEWKDLFDQGSPPLWLIQQLVLDISEQLQRHQTLRKLKKKSFQWSQKIVNISFLINRWSKKCKIPSINNKFTTCWILKFPQKWSNIYN